MSSVSMNAALSGLLVAQQQINTISANISNASTPGYTDKILNQTTQVVNGQAVGVDTQALTRVINQTLINDVNAQNSTTGYATAQTSYYQQLQSFQGNPTDGTSLSDTLTNLDNTFTQLSQSPNSPTLQGQVITAAQQTSSQINSYANLITNLRSQTETQISSDVSNVNSDLQKIAQLNVQITSLAAQGQSVADLQDQRDDAINDISQYMQINTSSNGNTVTVLTPNGTVLANNAAQTLYFTPSNMTPSSYYGAGGNLSGITVGSPTGTDIAAGGNVGGQMGGLLNMRDNVLPQYQAQLDEFSQNLAKRFSSEGLNLFTDANGNIPSSASAVNYVGFSTNIQVNPAILAKPGLVQQGTSGPAQPADSSEVINRITQYTFGSYQYQQAAGTVNISDNTDPLTSLFSPPLTTSNNVTGTVNLAAYSDFSTLPGDTNGLPDSFSMTLGTNTQTITVNTTDTAASIASQINTAFGSTVSSVNSSGQLSFNYNGDITLADNGDVLPALGLTAGTTAMPAVTFNVQVGTNPAVTVSIQPTDTSTDLLTKLNAISGVTASLNASGQLVILPKNGGGLTVTDVNGGLLSSMGVSSTNVAFAPFKQTGVGATGTLTTGLLGNSSLQDYITSSLSDQSEAANLNKTQSTNETSYLNTLQTQNSDVSGVSIDQQMTNLIQVQSAYTAAAKLITSSQTLFQDLLAAFPNS